MTTAKTKWAKTPSVTYGGKQYFYTARINGKRFWVVWDRVVRKWAVDMEVLGGKKTLAHAMSPETGKRIAERLAYPQKQKPTKKRSSRGRR